MIETIHRQAILKLINYFTRTPSNHDAQTTTNSNSSSGEAQLYRFKEPCDFINLPSITRLGAVISKFDQFFRPSGHLLEAAHSLKSPYNSVNILYLQQITELVQFIELNLFDSIPNIRNERINVDTSQALQSSEHLHALILIIKDWIQQFYIDDTNILPSIFPVLNEGKSRVKLYFFVPQQTSFQFLFSNRTHYLQAGGHHREQHLRLGDTDLQRDLQAARLLSRVHARARLLMEFPLLRHHGEPRRRGPLRQ